MEQEYFPGLSEGQINDTINSLPLNQKTIYDRLTGEYQDRRRALFIAKSFPRESITDPNGGKE